MNKLIKIVFVIENLNAGGAERVFRTLVSDFDRSLFDVTLLLFNYDNNIEKRYTIPENTKVIILNKSKKNALFSLVKTIKKLNPDVVMSTLSPINILCILTKIILRNKKTKYIIRETTIKSISIEQTKDNFLEKKIYKTLIKRLYNYADSIISLSEGAKIDLVANFGIKENKIKVIYNPLNINLIQTKSREKVKDINLNKNSKKIVCVGSLVKSKGHRYLIEALRILNFEKNYNIEAYFIGEGKLKEELINEVNLKKLINKVHFLGFKSNPYKYVKNSDIFVLPALWEGFGNVIVEAMACGIPVISSNCESGPKEIIEDNYNGLLIEPQNVNDLVEKIQSLLDDKILYNKISKNALIRANDFDAKKIVKQYENYIMSSSL